MENNPRETGIVHLWDLSEKKVYLAFEENYKKGIIYILRNFFSSLKDMSVGLDIPLKGNQPTLIRGFIDKRSTSLYVIKKISNFLVLKGFNEFSLKHLEKKIILIKSKGGYAKPILNPKFPMDFNHKEGAIIVSGILHDGGIEKHYSEPFYSNLNEGMRIRFFKAVEKVVGDVKVSRGLNTDDKEVDYPQILGHILISLGLKNGKKGVTNVGVPSFIFNCPKEVIGEFLAQVIADDGYVSNFKNGIREIAVRLHIEVTSFSEELKDKILELNDSAYAPQLLLDDKKLFERLGLKVHGPRLCAVKSWEDKKRHKRLSYGWRIRIHDWKSMFVLYQNLIIPIKYKQEALEKLVKHCTLFSRYQVLSFIKKCGSKITSNCFSRNMGIDLESASKKLHYLAKKGYLTKNYFRKGNLYPLRINFELSKKANLFLTKV